MVSNGSASTPKSTNGRNALSAVLMGMKNLKPNTAEFYIYIYYIILYSYIFISDEFLYDIWCSMLNGSAFPFYTPLSLKLYFANVESTPKTIFFQWPVEWIQVEIQVTCTNVATSPRPNSGCRSDSSSSQLRCKALQAGQCRCSSLPPARKIRRRKSRSATKTPYKIG